MASNKILGVHAREILGSDGMPALEETFIVPILKLRGIWAQPGTKMWGASWDMTNAMTQRCVQSCPFASAEISTEEKT